MARKGPRQAPRAERFWAKVIKSDGCWLWEGPFAKRRGGYGHFYDDGPRLRRAHRVAWELTHGELPDGAVVMHICDTPPCVRPDHLKLGTQAENMADMQAKGRRSPVHMENLRVAVERRRKTE